MSVVTVVGHPRADSRTQTVAIAAGEAIAARLGGPVAHELVDLSALGPHLLAPAASPGVEAALGLVAEASVLLVAGPTYKGTYTGLLKAFLDRLPPAALAGRSALPLLVMGDPKHSLAVEVHLRPLLVELGASVPTPGLAFLESQLPDLREVVAAWAEQVVPQLPARVPH
ncbi:NAD(P)H-dependent oxidoreductase [Actinomadura sp. ATCC 31491]|uniref:NAD(P)H-dependent oxidoreductase n=1 Tax=Actinomadura luzonensis TaxID=2805427 RepID=A0ABT0G6E2_9ACTN|nr:NADPH-dependent FMN reductase [Actinomadura luzonensis]MCK2220147.1 NAD(P)H-dependent oxidoreductase [Actinomadura luzonensis]